jgi:membrane protein
MGDRRSFPARFGLGGIPPLELARRTWEQIGEHELLTRAAAASYYALTAFIPFLGLIVTLAAQLAPDITGPSGARSAIGSMTVDEFREGLSRFLPSEGYEVVAGEIARIQQQPPIGLLSFGLVVSLALSSSFAWAVIDALNRIHGVAETRSYLVLASTAIGLTVLEAVIMLGTLVVLVVWPQVSGWLGWNRTTGLGREAAAWVVVAFAVLLSFDLTFHVGPNVHRRWEWITPGSVLGTVAFLASGLLLRIYVHYFGNYGKTYGSLGGVVLLSFWFWMAAAILLAAVQLNKVVEDEKEARES